MNNSLKRQAFLAALALLLASLASTVSSEDSHGEEVGSAAEAAKAAYQYSFSVLEENDQMPGIGIIIAFGTGNGVTAEQVGKAFVEELVRRGMRARFFFYRADWEGISMSFRVGYSAMGPWDSDTAAGNVGNVVARAEGAQRVHQKIRS